MTAAAMNQSSYRFAFVLDQQVGLRSQALNLERIVSKDGSLAPTWVPVCYDTAHGPWMSRLPGLPQSIRGTMAGVEEIRRGLGSGHFDATLWATWAAKSVLDLVAAAPAFLVMDMTPVQMEAMGATYGYSRSRARFMGGWKRRATERLYQKAAHLFPWNQWVADSLISDYGVSPDRITPVSPGVDTTLFRPAPERKANDGVVRLLFVGGDFYRKGGDLLLKWARETTVRTAWELHIVTRDDPGQVLPDGVFLHGGLGNQSDELIRLYQQSDVFVLPTRADCYSLVALEAMACGVPVVISDLGGIPEIVSHGETGFLLTGEDPGFRLAEHVDTLIEDGTLRAKMGAASLENVRTNFDAEKNVGRILERMRREAAKS